MMEMAVIEATFNVWSMIWFRQDGSPVVRHEYSSLSILSLAYSLHKLR